MMFCMQHYYIKFKGGFINFALHMNDAGHYPV
jgi:hypothetical protein